MSVVVVVVIRLGSWLCYMKVRSEDLPASLLPWSPGVTVPAEDSHCGHLCPTNAPVISRESLAVVRTMWCVVSGPVAHHTPRHTVTPRPQGSGVTSLGAAPHHQGFGRSRISAAARSQYSNIEQITGPVFPCTHAIGEASFCLCFVVHKLYAGKETETFDDDTAIRLLIEISFNAVSKPIRAFKIKFKNLQTTFNKIRLFYYFYDYDFFDSYVVVFVPFQFWSLSNLVLSRTTRYLFGVI